MYRITISLGLLNLFPKLFTITAQFLTGVWEFLTCQMASRHKLIRLAITFLYASIWEK